VERRYIQFALISFAILLGSQALQAYLFPRPARQPANENKQGAAAAPAPAAATEAATTAGESSTAAIAAAPASTTDGERPAAGPRARHVLGSLDPDSPARMLVTLTSRGAAVERIELAGKRYLDQDDWSGYLGHLALEETPSGCRIGIVGDGTPAKAAGLAVGDVIATVGGTATPDPETLLKTLATMKPGQRVAIEVERDGRKEAREVVLGRRPLEVVRPEYRTLPIDDPDGRPHDPLSFRLSLESRDGARRGEPLGEIPGQELADRDWVVEKADGNGVRFATELPSGLRVAKEYRLLADGQDGYRLDLVIEFGAGDRESRVVYALDGPTGLPTEGWWYTARVARDWGTLAVRDVAMRFVGEQSTLVSGLKLAEAAVAPAGDAMPPATAVREEKPLSFAGVDALYFASALIPATEGPEAPALEEVRPLVVGDVPAAARRKLVDVTCRLVSREVVVPPGGTVKHRYGVFAGPKKPELLAAFGADKARMDDLV
jgi:YidC/Oxa1 family membrane protein insertase